MTTLIAAAPGAATASSSSSSSSSTHQREGDSAHGSIRLVSAQLLACGVAGGWFGSAVSAGSALGMVGGAIVGMSLVSLIIDALLRRRARRLSASND